MILLQVQPQPLLLSKAWKSISGVTSVSSKSVSYISPFIFHELVDYGVCGVCSVSYVSGMTKTFRESAWGACCVSGDCGAFGVPMECVVSVCPGYPWCL